MKRLGLLCVLSLLLLTSAVFAQDASVTLRNGDADNNGVVNSADSAVLDAAFGSNPDSANWNANADLDGDHNVTLFDYTIVDNHYGQTGAAALTGTTGTIGGQYYVTVRITLSNWIGYQQGDLDDRKRVVQFRLKKQNTTTTYDYTVSVLSGSDVVLALPSDGTYDGTAISSHFLRSSFTVTTHQDTTAPIPGTATCNARVPSGAVAVSYSGASDTQSGIKKVELWVKAGSSGTWTNTGLTCATGIGSYSYTPTSVGTYYFDLVAEDNCGNRSAAASGLGDCSVLYGSAGTCTFLQVVMP